MGSDDDNENMDSNQTNILRKLKRLGYYWVRSMKSLGLYIGALQLGGGKILINVGLTAMYLLISSILLPLITYTMILLKRKQKQR